ncbi:Uncharacterised protein [Raoultella planticola]|uniref:Uncharacterized protein n=1 Tax=Raoultella planticola TaxID=575 RepID=A0A485BQE1_RAOPL|nr:Uncharacterised protein [Raoultella planticola]
MDSPASSSVGGQAGSVGSKRNGVRAELRIDSLGKGLTNALCRLALVRTDFRAGTQAHGDIFGQFGLLSERLKRLPVLLGDDRQPCLMRLRRMPAASRLREKFPPAPDGRESAVQCPPWRGRRERPVAVWHALTAGVISPGSRASTCRNVVTSRLKNPTQSSELSVGITP